MSKKTEVILLPVLLNGLLFSVDPTGNLAITTDGRAIRLSDSETTNSRFK